MVSTRTVRTTRGSVIFKTVIVVMSVCVAALGESVAIAPEANAVTSPKSLEITLDMNECGVMYVGTVGSCIISLQTWMDWSVGEDNYRGHDMIQVNGVYDQDTLRMVEKFQAEYAPGVTPDGYFGSLSRKALREWYLSHSRAKKDHVPCNPGNGWGCDVGAAVPGLNLGAGGGVVKTVVCTAVGALTADAGGVFCDLTLE